MKWQDSYGWHWLPFWTPAERAGLKAMGDGVIFARENRFTKRTMDLVTALVQAYVNAARAVKEGK